MTTELFEHLDRLRNAEGKVALATLVNTRGTTPRKEGAKMLVGEGGRVLGSVTIGGCVDAQVIEESANVLDKNAPRLLALDHPDAALRFHEAARAHAETGGRGAVITRLDAEENGAKLLLLDTGKTEGTLGDAALDRRFTAEAQEALTAGKSK